MLVIAVTYGGLQLLFILLKYSHFLATWIEFFDQAVWLFTFVDWPLVPALCRFLQGKLWLEGISGVLEDDFLAEMNCS